MISRQRYLIEIKYRCPIHQEYMLQIMLATEIIRAIFQKLLGMFFAVYDTMRFAKVVLIVNGDSNWEDWIRHFCQSFVEIYKKQSQIVQEFRMP